MTDHAKSYHDEQWAIYKARVIKLLKNRTVDLKNTTGALPVVSVPILPGTKIDDGAITPAKLSFDPATQTELDAHAADTTAIHGIADTSLLLDTGDLTASHNHTSASADGGPLTNDEHDGYSVYTEIAAPSSPAANTARLYGKDVAGVTELFYKNSSGTERDLSSTGGGGGTDTHTVSSSAPSTPVAGDVWLDTSASGAAGTIEVEEVDGSPTDSAVTKIVFPNGTLGIASHVATYTPASGGTVTSVALTVPSILSVAGSPVTTSGTLAVTLATESANTTFAGPTTGGAATPTFRALVAADLPNTTVGAGAYGGTGTTAAFTVDAAGRLTAAVTQVPSFSASVITGGTLAVARGGTGVGALPAFLAHKNGTDQTGVLASTFTKLTFSTEVFDTNTNFASDKFTPTIAGLYLLVGSMRFNSSSVGAENIVALYKNGAEVARGTFVASTTTMAATSVTALQQANGSTDYFELYVFQSSSGTQTVAGYFALTYFGGAWMGP